MEYGPHLSREELSNGIWLSEQSPERQRDLLGKCFFEENWAQLIVFVSPPNERAYQDIIFGGNEESVDRYAQGIETKLGKRISRIEHYRLIGKWCMTQQSLTKFTDNGPLKRDIPNNILIS